MKGSFKMKLRRHRFATMEYAVNDTYRSSYCQNRISLIKQIQHLLLPFVKCPALHHQATTLTLANYYVSYTPTKDSDFSAIWLPIWQIYDVFNIWQSLTGMYDFLTDRSLHGPYNVCLSHLRGVSLNVIHPSFTP